MEEEEAAGEVVEEAEEEYAEAPARLEAAAEPRPGAGPASPSEEVLGPAEVSSQ